MFLQQRKEMGWHAGQQADAATPPKLVGDPSADILAQASDLYQQRRFAESASLFAQLTSSRLFADQAHYGLGVIALVQGDRSGAVAHLQNAIAVNPGLANAHFYMGELAEQSGDTAAAGGHYQRALAADPRHAGAARAVARLAPVSAALAPAPQAVTGPALSGPASSAAIPVVVSAPLPRAEAVPAAGGLGVYEYLRSDTTKLSRDTVASLEALELRRHSAFLAWAGGLLLRAGLYLAVLVVVAIVELSSGTDLPDEFLWVFAGLLCAAYVLRAVTTVYDLSGGRLTVERGIIWRRTRQLELWRVQNIELRRGFVDRITGHGELRFISATAPGGAAKVRGLVRGRRLRELQEQLLNLVFLLRSNPVVKGIIS